jgi:two-component system cell cycle response regulator
LKPVAHEIEDERTRGERIARPQDKEHEDVSLLVLGGPDQGKRVLVKPPGGVLGRQPGCVIQIRDPNISRRHALLEFTSDGRVMLTDLGSRNGVFINGARISRAEVFDGNNVQISNETVLRVRFQDPAETELLDELHGANIKDNVTGLPNRRYLTRRLAQELSYARRHSEPLAVVLIDIDEFHRVNEVDGQAAGDALLRELAKVVREDARLEDVVTRYGSDQFVVVMRKTDAAHAMIFAGRVCEAVRGRTYDVGDVPIRASVSCGIASHEPAVSDIKEVRELLDHADAAVYHAKALSSAQGKSRVARWEAPPPRAAVDDDAAGQPPPERDGAD